MSGKIHYDQSLGDGTFIPRECAGPFSFDADSGTFSCDTCGAKQTVRSKSAEQQARDMLERMEVEGAQSFSAGELIELADVIADASAYRRMGSPRVGPDFSQ